MLGPGASRRRIARVLNTAYADGLLSEETFAQRLDRVLADRLIDPRALIGDLTLRTVHHRWDQRLRGAAATALGTIRLRGPAPIEPPAVLLALDWDGGKSELVLGRRRDCDVVLSSDAVSRRHAKLSFRDGNWVIRDLGSTNGTRVNGIRVGRCRLRPGDRIALGDALLRVD